MLPKLIKNIYKSSCETCLYVDISNICNNIYIYKTRDRDIHRERDIYTHTQTDTKTVIKTEVRRDTHIDTDRSREKGIMKCWTLLMQLWTRHAGHFWRSRDELIRDVLLWTPTHGHAKAGRPAWTYIQQLCEDTGCCPEDLPRARNDREEWRERVRDICATSATWWWWWWK